MDDLVWNDDYTEVYGLKSHFDNIDDFERNIRNYIRQYLTDVTNYKIENLREEQCIHSNTGIEAERVIPMRLVNITITDYYYCDVVETDGD